MTLNLNRDRIGLLLAIDAGDVSYTGGGILMRRYPDTGNKARVAEGKLRELQDAGLIDGLQLTPDGKEAAATGTPHTRVPRQVSSDFGPAARLGATAPDVTSILRWEDPPATERRGRWTPVVDWYRIAAQLRDKPGQWALVLVDGTSAQMAAQIRGGSVSVALRPGGAFDAKSVRIDGEFRLYARYTGGEQ